MKDLDALCMKKSNETFSCNDERFHLDRKLIQIKTRRKKDIRIEKMIRSLTYENISRNMSL